jgi:hypothetical protein
MKRFKKGDIVLVLGIRDFANSPKWGNPSGEYEHATGKLAKIVASYETPHKTEKGLGDWDYTIDVFTTNIRTRFRVIEDDITSPGGIPNEDINSATNLLSL